jgi:hypothetical protein
MVCVLEGIGRQFGMWGRVSGDSLDVGEGVG